VTFCDDILSLCSRDTTPFSFSFFYPFPKLWIALKALHSARILKERSRASHFFAWSGVGVGSAPVEHSVWEVIKTRNRAPEE